MSLSLRMTPAIQQWRIDSRSEFSQQLVWPYRQVLLWEPQGRDRLASYSAPLGEPPPY